MKIYLIRYNYFDDSSVKLAKTEEGIEKKIQEIFKEAFAYADKVSVQILYKGNSTYSEKIRLFVGRFSVSYKIDPKVNSENRDIFVEEIDTEELE